MPAKGHGPTATFTPNGSDRFRPVILPHLRRSDRSASRRPVRAEHPTHGTSARPHAVWKTACFGWAYFGCKREHTSGRPRPAQRAPRFSAQEGKALTAFPRKSAAPDPPRKRPPVCPTTTCSLSDSTSIYSDGILSLGCTSIHFTTSSASAGNIPIHSAGIPGKPRHRETNQDPTFPTKHYENRPLRRRHPLSWAAPLFTPTTFSASTGNILMHSDDIPEGPLDIENQPGPDLPHQALRKPPPPKTTLSPLGCTSIHSDNILRIRRQHSHAFRRHSRRPVRHRKPTLTKQSEREYRIFSSELPLPLPLAGPQRPCRFLPDANKRAVP